MTKKSKKLFRKYIIEPTLAECDPKLNEGEKLCPKCEGKPKYIVKDDSVDYRYNPYSHCPFCDGTGKVTWTEEMCGGKKKLVLGA